MHMVQRGDHLKPQALEAAKDGAMIHAAELRSLLPHTFVTLPSIRRREGRAPPTQGITGHVLQGLEDNRVLSMSALMQYPQGGCTETFIKATSSLRWTSICRIAWDVLTRLQRPVQTVLCTMQPL